MKLTYDNNRFICRCAFDERSVPKDLGFTWDKDAKQWYTTTYSKAEKLSKLADTKALAALYAASQRLQASRASDANVEIPCPPGLAYLPYQKAGIAYAKGKSFCGIFDEQGLGKTIQALGLINNDETIKSVLVICPKSVIINWKREAAKWLVREVRVEVINYDILRRYDELFGPGTWDLLIADEAQYLKNPSAKRTQYFYRIPTRRILWLTGTPIENRPRELWPIIQKADPEGWGRDFMTFARRFCDAKMKWVPCRGGRKQVWDFDGASNLDELKDYLRQSFMVRRLKSEVLKDLPAKTHQLIVLPTNGVKSIIADEVKAMDVQAAIRLLKSGVSIPFDKTATTRHELGVAKVQPAVDHITDVLESGGKIIVFAYHRDVIAALEVELYTFNPVVVTGSTNQQQRQAAVDRFQTDPGCRVFLGNIEAAGTGITLTAGSTVLFVEQDWVPGRMAQAEDRAHRIGQKKNVLVQYLVFDGSFDAHLCETLVVKENIINEVMG